MFVQEEKIFAGKVLRLHVCASDGVEWLEEATEDTSVEQLKERCLKHVSRADRGARPLRLPPARPPSAAEGTAPPAPVLSHTLLLTPPRSSPRGTGLSALRSTLSFDLHNRRGRGSSGN